MKLVRLEINDQFRSLKKGFTVSFHTDGPNDPDDLNGFHPFCFAGLNGTGKSNVLEALANIFFHVEAASLRYRPTTFESHFDLSRSSPDAYRLEYLIGHRDSSDRTLTGLNRVQIVKMVDREPVMKVQQFPFSKNQPWRTIPVKSSIPGEPASSQGFLPDLVVGYSSGENEILSIPFIKSKLLQYDEYLQALEKKEAYSRPESSLVYMDYETSQAILLANLLFQDELVLAPIHSLGITRVRSFRLNINLHKHEFLNEKGNKQTALITQQLTPRVTKLKNCSTSWFEDSSHGRLVLDFFVNEATKSAVKKNFRDAFDFFRTLQVLYVLNNRLVSDAIKEDIYQSRGYYTEGKLPSLSPSDNVFYFLDYFVEIRRNGDKPRRLLMRQLSDGEHQFLHAIGICLLLKNHRTLILLDEPETHFNPEWRSKLVKTLKASIDVSGNNNLLTEIVLTSHSPFIISDCLPDKVIVFSKDRSGRVMSTSANDLLPPLNTYGTSVNLITSRIFGRKETIGAHSLERIEAFRKRFLAGEETVKLQAELNHEIGDSIEKLLLINEMHERESAQD